MAGSYNLSASAKAALGNSGADTMVAEAYVNVLARGLDKVWKRDNERPKQGMQFLREMTTPGMRESASYRTYRSAGGIVGHNRDAEDIPFIVRGEGFGFSVTTYNFRQGIQIEKTLQEVDDVGVVRSLQTDLIENSDLSVELAIADIFNRGCNPSSAPVLADDGMYFIDSSRPNANPAAGTWSNEETASAITPSSIYQAQLNARAMTDENGELAPTFIKQLIIRPQDEKTVWEIQKSDYRPTDAMNAKNYLFGRFEYVVYDFLTDACIYYMVGDAKSDKNELMFFWRVKPELKTWVGDNPDVIKQRIRFAFGLGLGSPRKVWRGGEVS